MGERTSISWTDHTFSPWWGCSKVSAGCTNCFAEAFAKRLGKKGLWAGQRRFLSEEHWCLIPRWNRRAEREGVRRRVFCGSMCDVFEDNPLVLDERERLWWHIERTPHLVWQLLTKRPENIRRFLPPDWGACADGYRNVWLGVSVEDASTAHRIGSLQAIDATVRFISYEPALGPICTPDRAYPDLTGIHWLIYGGESGPRARPDSAVWAREALRLCRELGIAFFAKQGSGRLPGRQGSLPDDLWACKEFPA